MPIDAHGCVKQLPCRPQADDLTSREPPLYDEHIHDQPYLARSFLAGFPYEMGAPLYHSALPELTVSYGHNDASDRCNNPIRNNNAGSTNEAMEVSPGSVSSLCTPRSMTHFDIGDLLLDVLPPYVAAPLVPPPAVSPGLPPHYESMNTVGEEEHVDEDRGPPVSETYLTDCWAEKAELEA